LRLNGASHVVEGPIEGIASSVIRERLAGRDLDMLYGGPPCQPFSKAGYWATGDSRRLDDPRAATLHEYFRLVDELRPRAFLLENVHGISYSGKEEGFLFLLERIHQINRRHGTSYRPAWAIVNAADYGVPQLRIRFFLVAFREGSTFSFPSPTHQAIQSTETDEAPELFGSALPRHTTAWDAIGHLHPDPGEALAMTGRWAALLPSIPEGENYLWHTERRGGLPLFGWRTRYWSFLLKLAKAKPSWTIQAQPGSAIGPFHWSNRRLSWREMAALQTFPADFRIQSSRVEIQRQIGNAVPSHLAEILARAIREILSGRKSTAMPKLAVSRAASIPKPETIQPVPAEFLHLKGKHQAHPGTGKGRSYRELGEKVAT
jgi:DNA (cytosine-5)-methyltransferase 1